MASNHLTIGISGVVSSVSLKEFELFQALEMVALINSTNCKNNMILILNIFIMLKTDKTSGF